MKSFPINSGAKVLLFRALTTSTPLICDELLKNKDKWEFPFVSDYKSRFKFTEDIEPPIAYCLQLPINNLLLLPNHKINLYRTS